MKNRFLCSLLFSCAIGTSVAQTVTLDSCLAQAARNFPAVKKYDLIAKSRDYTVSNAGKGWLPQFSVTGIAGYVIQGLPSSNPNGETSDKFQLIGIGQLNQTLWDGGETKARKEAATSAADAERAATDVELFQIRQQVEEIYFGILLLDDQQKNVQLLLETLNRQQQAVQLSSENGLAFTSDVDEIRIEVLRAGQKQTELQYARLGYVNMLALLTGQPLDQAAVLERPAAVTVKLADNKRPELSVFQYQKQQAEAEWNLKHTGVMPRIGLMGAGILIEPGALFGVQKINSLAIAGLSVSWNIGGLYRNSNDKELSKLKVNMIDAGREIFMFQNNLQQTGTNAEITKQQSLVASDREIVNLRNRVTKAYELKRNNGLCTVNDLLNAISAENEARVNQSIHETQLLKSIYTFNTLTGN